MILGMPKVYTTSKASCGGEAVRELTWIVIKHQDTNLGWVNAQNKIPGVWNSTLRTNTPVCLILLFPGLCFWSLSKTGLWERHRPPPTTPIKCGQSPAFVLHYGVSLLVKHRNGQPTRLPPTLNGSSKLPLAKSLVGRDPGMASGGQNKFHEQRYQQP